MSTGTNGDEIDLEDWFDAFRKQSSNMDALGDLSAIVPRRLGGGKSGATAALFDPSEGPIVLKWDSLDKVVQESQARRARPDQEGSMKELRRRGASHIALHEGPSSDVLFGIMAYPYIGPTDPGADLVGDFEWFLRDKYVPGSGDNTLQDVTLQWVYQELLEYFDRFPQGDGQTPSDTRTLNLPDLKDWRTRLDVAAKASKSIQDAAGILSTLKTWASQLFTRQPKPSFLDSRLIHGDPRFANIMVDLEQHRVGLIDFGAGSPGRHIFRDFARFEVDILLRTTGEICGSHRTDDISARGRELFAHESGDFNQLRTAWQALQPSARVAAIWRHERNEKFPDFHKEKVRELHALFVATELLRRIEWYADPGETDAGATTHELLLALRVLMESVPA